MKQNSYISKDFLVFGELLEEDSHIRKISRNTKINFMSVKRIVDKFLDKNILDFKMDGKNKTFFVKDNFEAKNMKILYEVYQRMDLSKGYPIIRKIFEKIFMNKEIKLAILFGSYAKRRAHSKSDIDIYIETKKLKLKKDVEKINSKISVKIGNFDKENILIKEIIKNHVIIKGVEEYYGK